MEAVTEYVHPPGWLERLTLGRPVAPDLAYLQVAHRPFTALLGRIGLSAIFLLSGVMKFVDPEGATAYMNAEGIPYASTLLILAAMAEVTGGFLILSGFMARLGGLILIAFLIPTTLIFHDFWNLTGQEAKTQMVNFMKNLAIFGGLFLIVAHGAGRLSIDQLIRRRHGVRE